MNTPTKGYTLNTFFYSRAAKHEIKRTTNTRYSNANNTPKIFNYYKIYKCSKILLSWLEASCSTN